MNAKKDQLATKFPDILLDEPLKKYSTFQIGGPADYFYKLQKTELLPELTKFCHTNGIPFLIIGAGSNILFDDKGFRGLIIKIETSDITISGDEITADAGTTISQLINTATKHNLSGLEPWLGLPGTVGAAVRGNAGCNGLETKDILKKATIFDTATGHIAEIAPPDLHLAYRDSRLKTAPNEIVLSATFKLDSNTLNTEEQQRLSDEARKLRFEKQPFGRATTGSFFKNPSPDKPAGMLIDQAGLKGRTIGQAQISEKHANFFLNLGGASSADMIELASLAKREVKAKFNIDLEEEVQIISENGPMKL